MTGFEPPNSSRLGRWNRQSKHRGTQCRYTCTIIYNIATCRGCTGKEEGARSLVTRKWDSGILWKRKRLRPLARPSVITVDITQLRNTFDLLAVVMRLQTKNSVVSYHNHNAGTIVSYLCTETLCKAFISCHSVVGVYKVCCRVTVIVVMVTIFTRRIKSGDRNVYGLVGQPAVVVDASCQLWRKTLNLSTTGRLRAENPRHSCYRCAVSEHVLVFSVRAKI